MAHVAHLEVDLVGPDGKVWAGEATMVVAPAHDGSLGVLPGHAPILALLSDGHVKIVPVSGASLTCDVGGGFLSVDSDRVTIVVDSVGELEHAAPSGH